MTIRRLLETLAADFASGMIRTVRSVPRALLPSCGHPASRRLTAASISRIDSLEIRRVLSGPDIAADLPTGGDIVDPAIEQPGEDWDHWPVDTTDNAVELVTDVDDAQVGGASDIAGSGAVDRLNTNPVACRDSQVHTLELSYATDAAARPGVDSVPGFPDIPGNTLDEPVIIVDSPIRPDELADDDLADSEFLSTSLQQPATSAVDDVVLTDAAQRNVSEPQASSAPRREQVGSNAIAFPASTVTTSESARTVVPATTSQKKPGVSISPHRPGSIALADTEWPFLAALTEDDGHGTALEVRGLLQRSADIPHPRASNSSAATSSQLLSAFGPGHAVSASGESLDWLASSFVSTDRDGLLPRAVPESALTETAAGDNAARSTSATTRRLRDDTQQLHTIAVGDATPFADNETCPPDLSESWPRELKYSINPRAPPHRARDPEVRIVVTNAPASLLMRLRYSIAPRGPSLATAELQSPDCLSCSGPRVSPEAMSRDLVC